MPDTLFSRCATKCADAVPLAAECNDQAKQTTPFINMNLFNMSFYEFI